MIFRTLKKISTIGQNVIDALYYHDCRIHIYFISNILLIKKFSFLPQVEILFQVDNMQFFFFRNHQLISKFCTAVLLIIQTKNKNHVYNQVQWTKEFWFLYIINLISIVISDNFTIQNIFGRLKQLCCKWKFIKRVFAVTIYFTILYFQENNVAYCICNSQLQGRVILRCFVYYSDEPWTLLYVGKRTLARDI